MQRFVVNDLVILCPWQNGGLSGAPRIRLLGAVIAPLNVDNQARFVLIGAK